tara:strand:- start:58 stop:453 length:396 start_codon:yes stop_codon:yes gene_type:complete
MKSIGVTFRKKNKLENGRVQSSSMRNLHKQILTLHKKLKKYDEVTTYYCIEKDFNKREYHNHLLIEYNDEKNLYDTLNRFIGGSSWNVEYDRGKFINVNNGIWGEIRVHDIYHKNGFLEYMNEFNLSNSLY